MSPLAPYALAAAAVVALLGAIAAIRAAGQRWHWNAEVQRKGVHVLVGLFSLLLPLIFATAGPVVVLLVLAIIVMIIMRARPAWMGGAGSAIHSVERRSLGDIWLATAVGFLFLRSEGSYILYALPLAIVTLSDAAAALTGSAYGRRRFSTEAGAKTWEGVIAFLMVGWIVAMAMLLLFSDASRGNVILLGFAIAAFGAMVEAVSWRGLDNLFVPLAVHFFLRGYLGADPVDLAIVAVLFAAFAIAAQATAPRLGLSRHAARAFAVGLFIFIGVGGIYGALAPLAAMIAYLLSRRHARPRGTNPDLDFLGTLCSAAAIWLFVGEMTGPIAIHFYALAMTGIALGYGLFGDIARKRPLAGLLLVPVAWAAYLAAGSAGIVAASLPPDAALLAAIALAMVAAVVVIRASWFERWCAPRLALTASVVPLTAYLSHARWP
jgi:phytol kinase